MRTTDKNIMNINDDQIKELVNSYNNINNAVYRLKDLSMEEAKLLENSLIVIRNYIQNTVEHKASEKNEK
ncbi:hypothetical protein [Pedobacter sp. UBA4863]|uniref:hypothetical protein n=1 Tax=Pedobacter sp. UBA4863 TaxID=1947060 RepID=UPI0025F4E978|nr:hypothetical protein [Pedobacter sp. UBA4863]